MKETRAFSKSLYVFCLCQLFGPSANLSSFHFLDLSLEETDHSAVVTLVEVLVASCLDYCSSFFGFCLFTFF